MDSSNKFTKDFIKGKNNREKWIVKLNKELELDGYRLIRKHDHLKTMKIHEKVKQNKLPNRIQEAPFHNAMGLYYELSRKERKKRVPIILLQKTIYVKTPSEYISDWEAYLQILSDFGYYIILVNALGGLFSLPISIDIFRKYWKPKKMESKGNRNRIQFYGKVSTINYFKPTQKNVFGESVISELKKLI